MKPTFLTTLILPALMATAGIAQANEGGNGMEASYLTRCVLLLNYDDHLLLQILTIFENHLC